MVCKPPSFAPQRAPAKRFEISGDAKRPSSSKRGYDRKWRLIRAAFLKAHPFCDCGARAVEADHQIPLRQGGTHAWSNLRPLCKPCHSRKTATRDGGFGNPKKSLGATSVDRALSQLPVSTKLIF